MSTIPRLNPFVCPDCGVWVRHVESTWGEILVLNAARDPLGRVVPWPSDRVTGQAQARLLPAGVPADSEDTWSIHGCEGVVGSGLFAQEPVYFGTRAMFSDARQAEILYVESEVSTWETSFQEPLK
jgi:hypothetical protein